MARTEADKLHPNKLRAHVTRYAQNRDGGEFWTWHLSKNRGAFLCRGPLGFRTYDEARGHAKLTVATIATGTMLRHIDVTLD